MWKEIEKLEKERGEIENRIAIRAALHHGKSRYMDRLTGEDKPITDQDRRNVVCQSVYDDAIRYIEIEDREWQILGLKDSGDHEQPPL
jgi:hypothetical protein